MFLEISSMFGLPAHALVVHAAVVLVPLAVVGFAATSWRRSWRYVYGIPVAALAVAGAVFAWLAEESGEPLEHDVRDAARGAGLSRPRFGDHPDQGEAAFLAAAVFALGVLAFLAVHHFGRRWKLPPWTGTAAYAVVLVPGALALLTMVAAGHSGAELVWKDVGSFAAGR
ncbi:MAG: hypothetical protein IT303_05180 [Dehalococcoidia bacterium]|nr:hypothetical protein [Dehalococcoidia bacterium]